MHKLIDAALLKGVKIGAHPSYPDIANFGRTKMRITPADLYDMVIHQLAGIEGFLRIKGGVLHHVKPHGALYNSVVGDAEEATAFLMAVRDYNPDLVVYGLSQSNFLRQAQLLGLKISHEVFADRRYSSDGSLVSRDVPGAVIEDIELAIEQSVRFSKGDEVETIQGVLIKRRADTICIHSDSFNSIKIAHELYKKLIFNKK